MNSFSSSFHRKTRLRSNHTKIATSYPPSPTVQRTDPERSWVVVLNLKSPTLLTLATSILPECPHTHTHPPTSNWERKRIPYIINAVYIKLCRENCWHNAIALVIRAHCCNSFQKEGCLQGFGRTRLASVGFGWLRQASVSKTTNILIQNVIIHVQWYRTFDRKAKIGMNETKINAFPDW